MVGLNFVFILALSLTCALLFVLMLWHRKRADMHTELVFLRQHERASIAQVAGLRHVLEHSGGGIGVRIRESIEITRTIQEKAPDLFSECQNLAYCLHANDQFLMALYRHGHSLMSDEQREMIKFDRETLAEGKIFLEVYENASLPAPSTEDDAPTGLVPTKV